MVLGGLLDPPTHILGGYGDPHTHSQAGGRRDSRVLMLDLGEPREIGAPGAGRCWGSRRVCGAEGSCQHSQGSPPCPTQGFPRAGTRSPLPPGPGLSSGPRRTSRPLPGVVGEVGTRAHPRGTRSPCSPSLCRLLARPRTAALGLGSPCSSLGGFFVRGVAPKPAMVGPCRGQNPPLPQQPQIKRGVWRGVGGSVFIGWGHLCSPNRSGAPGITQTLLGPAGAPFCRSPAGPGVHFCHPM